MATPPSHKQHQHQEINRCKISENQEQQDGSQSRLLGYLYRQNDRQGPCDPGVQCVGECHSHIIVIISVCANEIIFNIFSQNLPDKDGMGKSDPYVKVSNLGK